MFMKLQDMISEDKILLGMKFQQIKHTKYKLVEVGVKTLNACAWQNDEFLAK